MSEPGNAVSEGAPYEPSPDEAGNAVAATGAAEPAVVSTGHPAVDAALHAIANAADLPPEDQIAQYEAAHRTLQETLATIDES